MKESLNKYFDATFDEISQSRLLLGNQYAYTDDDSISGFSALSNRPSALKHEFTKTGVERHSIIAIEKLTKKLLNKLWKDRNLIWVDVPPPSPLGVIDPELTLELLGYDVELEETLGQFNMDGKLIDVAGTIDRDSNEIRISRQFSPSIRRFTAAHELGHALLHKENGLHRDRPVDGVNFARNLTELEADKFATFFLMPEKLVREIFKKLFLTDNFVLDEATSFALGFTDYQGVIKKYTSLRDLSRLLASTERYNGRQFISVAAQFQVSTEAMAIRLEELKLIEI